MEGWDRGRRVNRVSREELHLGNREELRSSYTRGQQRMACRLNSKATSIL